MLLVILKAKNLLEHFTKQNYKKQNKKNLGKKKMSNGKVMAIHLIVGLIKKT